MKVGVFVSDYSLNSDAIELVKDSGMGIIFVLNGVYHASIKENGNASALLGMTPRLYALKEDILTRGIKESDIDGRVKLVDYGEAVDLIFDEFEKIIWV